LTNAQVSEVVENAAKHGRVLDRYLATVFLGSKEFLAAHPDSQPAKDTVSEFSKFFAVGTPMTSFAQFMLPTFYTDEELAHQKKVRDEYLAAKAR
jgi:hypothetical protein